MGLIAKNIAIKIATSNYKHYLNKNYKFNNIGDIIQININDLPKSSSVKVNVVCDICEIEKKIPYNKYLKNISKYNIYSCSEKCSFIKKKNTNLKQYGTIYASQSKEIKEKTKQTNFKKYGVDYYSQTTEFKKRYKDTCIKKYGVDNIFKSVEFISNIKKNKKKLNINEIRKKIFFNKTSKLLNYNYNLINKNTNGNIIYHKNCESNFLICTDTLNYRINNNTEICLKCNPINNPASHKENEVKLFLDELNIKYESNNRSVLNGKDLDIYLPEYNVAIECNG